ncbi:helix-turn-helix domain-containing protein [Microbacterium maritypicum]|uniref:HTH cro/C1-type domain-containing protein n=1 Tax=Microbacterium maritypicum TaxID=33918 RepID=A0A4Y4B321_MICMQ|nr:helix-turn-helix transcriptional regulator [Microbacterium liquefaciens]GEC74756.1 hypothetical protein MLI01_09010 [Microbacterium liquefaciens]GGV51535.1 hypothetical protein GCM10010213_06720 [Microbacterium liquefaciens]
MKREITYEWRIRELMAKHRMKSSTDLVQPLKERGITFSASQVYRLVAAENPERIAFKVLFALCDIFSCSVEDLAPWAAADARTTRRKLAANGNSGLADLRNYRPARARVLDDEEDG